MAMLHEATDYLTLLFGCCLSVLITRVHSLDSPPVVSSVSQSLLVPEGSSFSLECAAIGAPPLQYQWLRDNQPISLPGLSPSFSLASATRQNSGIYRCLASNNVGAAFSQQFNVTVAYLTGFVSAAAVPKVQVRRGGSLVLTTPTLSADPLSDISWKWYFYDSVIYSNLTHFVSSAGELVLLDVQGSSGGQYKVEAVSGTLSGPAVFSPAFEVAVVDGVFGGIREADPQIALAPKGVTFNPDSNENDELVLECVAQSSSLSDVRIIWQHNGTEIVQDGVRYLIEKHGRRLRVKNPTFPQHGGLYKCKASRGFSSVQAQAWVNILQRPRISPLPATTLGNIGLSLSLPCLITSSPRASVHWYFNGQLVNDKPTTAENSLLINSVASHHTGVYQCLASNSAGSDVSSTWLRTQSSGPSLFSVPRNVSALAGQEIKLSCQANGAPAPGISWFLNDSAVLIDGAAYRLEPGFLVIPAVRLEQGGWYTCRAKNSEGATDAKAFVHVAGRTQIVKGPEDQSVVIGSNILFPCQVSQQDSADNQFTRSWYFNQQLLTAGSSRNIDLRPDGSLFIRQVGPSRIGTYTCTVTSPFGTRSQSAQLVIIEKPGMVLDVTAELINDTLPAKVIISWTDGFDGNSPIIKYLVELRTLGSKNLWSDWEPVVENVGRDQRSVVLDNLKPSSTYEFRVISINRLGAGIPSVPSSNITLPQQPPAAAPRSVAGSARSSSSLMLQWQPPPPDQWNGDILGYIVRYRLADYPNIPWIYHNISDSRARNVAIEDLITWREYEIQMSAFNDRGMGVFSKSLHITTKEGVPAVAPSDVNITVINSTALHVAFTPPAHQMIPGVNLGYKIECWRGTPAHGHLARLVKVLPYNLQRIEQIVWGLSKFTGYNVTVLAYTAPGDGPRTRPMQIKTKQDIPGPVLNMHFDEVLDTSVTVRWSAPEEPNGILKNYTLNYWQKNQRDTTQTVSILPTVTSHRVTGLTASTHYNFELFASTEAGRGPSEGATMQSGVPPELPGAPSSLVVSNVQPRSCILQFVPGFDGKTIIKEWIVEAQIGQSTSWTLIYNVSAPRARSLTIPTLRPFTSYRLRLIARNVRGRSPESVPTERFETQQTVPEAPPTDLSAEPDSSTSVLVSWTALPTNAWNGRPKGYQLFYRKNNTFPQPGDFGAPPTVRRLEEYNEVMISDSGASEYRVENLHPFEMYEFKMFAVNELGQSQESPLLSARTYEDVPSQAPQNVQVSAENPTAVRVTWNEVPTDASNGRILGYRLSYAPENPRISYEAGEVEVIGAERRHYYLANLRAYTSYKIQLAAFTVIGSGPVNEPALRVRTMEDTPGPPSAIQFEYVSLSEVRIGWRPPYRPNGIILRYQVSHWRNDSDPRTAVRSEPLASDLHLFMASGLQSQTTYAFTVVAETVVGWGEEQKVFVFTTNAKVPPSPPSTPIESAMLEKGPTKVNIKWNTISTPTAPIRLIDVEYQKVNEGNWVEWIERVPGVLSHTTIHGLDAHTSYKFRVRAVNDFGKSQWSAASGWIRTLDDAPNEAPSEIDAKPHDSTSIKVTWKVPKQENWNSDYVGYRILYKIYDNMNETFQRKETPMRGVENDYEHYVIDELTRFKHYMVQLQTFNQQGSSKTSTPSFVYVGYSIPKNPVSNLVAETKSSTQIQIAWDAWGQDREPISGVKVRYRPSLFSGTQWTEDVVKGGAMLLLRDLAKFTEYDVRVTAFNKAGEGPKAEATAKTLEDRPGLVGELLFSDILLNSVNVSWAPPNEPNGRIIGYSILYKTYKWKDDFKQETQEKITNNFFRPGDLEENVTYTFSVRAETKMGFGPAREGKVKIGPTEGSPQPPQKAKIYPSDTSVTLEWSNSAPGSSAIIGYIIQAKRISGKRREKRQTNVRDTEHPLGVWVILTHVDGPDPSHEIGYNELHPSSIYVFRVFARNRLGVSYPSPETEQVTVPETVDAFYTKWWFLVIVACAFVVILLVVVLILCITGRSNKFRYEKRSSFDSLQLADGGVVAYELRASQRARAIKDRTNHAPPRPDPSSQGWYGHEDRRPARTERPPSYGSVIRTPGSAAGSKPPSVYGSLITDNVDEPRAAVVHSNNAYRHSHLTEESYANRQTAELDTSTTGEEGSDSEVEEQNIASIVQHYQSSDAPYIETWRRAKRSAAHNRPPSLTSAQSDNYSVTGAPNGQRPGIPGFSSFV